MPVYRPRTRLVNFRLSEDEYKILKDISAASGSRSVSDYARAAVLSGPSSHVQLPVAPFAPCQDRWERLENVVLQLESRISQWQEKEMVPTHG